METIAEQPMGEDERLEIAEAWDILLNVDDRTSPEEYPDMCLITRDELERFMLAALATPKPAEQTTNLIARLRAYRPTNEWGGRVWHSICDEAADALTTPKPVDPTSVAGERMKIADVIRPIIMRGFRDRLCANDVTDAVVVGLAAATEAMPDDAVERAIARIPKDAFWRVGHDGEGADPSQFKARVFEPMTQKAPSVGYGWTPADALSAALATNAPDAAKREGGE